MSAIECNQYSNYLFSHADLEPVNVAEFNHNPDLARDQHVIILVKWLNQEFHDDNLRSIAKGKWDPIKGVSINAAATHKNQYYEGLVAQTLSLIHI